MNTINTNNGIPFRAAPRRGEQASERMATGPLSTEASIRAAQLNNRIILKEQDNGTTEPLQIAGQRSRIVVEGHCLLPDRTFIAAECEISGDKNARLELNGTAVTIGGARSITNNLTADRDDAFLISGILKINDTPPLRKTVTLTGSGRTMVSGLIENNRGSGSLTCAGNIVITGESNTYTGVTTVVLDSTLRITCLTDGGLPSSIGASSTVPSNLIISGNLAYIGERDSATNRLFTINSTVGTTITNANPGSEGWLAFTNQGEAGMGSSNMPRSLTLDGVNTGLNRLNAALSDNGQAATEIIKRGAGNWIMAGTSTYTGGTTIHEGTLVVGGLQALGVGSVMVCDKGTLAIGGAGCDCALLGHGILIINGRLRLQSPRSAIGLTGGGMYIFNGTLDLCGAFDALPPGNYPIITGGGGSGRYVDNMRPIVGYNRPGHRATFRQGILTIEKQA